MNQPLLQVRDLKVHFPIFAGIIRRPIGVVKALDGVDLDLQKGQILGIVGETGSGKTTLGRAILRLIEPTSGQILYKGNDLLTCDSAQLQDFRKQAQIVFQDPFASLNPRKNIRDAIGEALLFHKVVNTRQAQAEKVAEILSLVGLSPDVMPRYPHEFSGGQQQRICIARAIALEPQLVICDEASSALDVSIQAQILNLLLALKKKLHLSYIIISHDLSLVRYLCDNVVVLYLGKIMESASVSALFNNPRHPYTQALLSAIPKSHPGDQKTRIPLSGEIPSPSHPPSGCPFRTRCPYAQDICAQPPPRHYIPDPATGQNTHFYDCILPPAWTNNGHAPY